MSPNTLPLDVRCLMGFGIDIDTDPVGNPPWYHWTDCTADLRTASDQAVSIAVGRADRAQTPEPNTGAFSLNNFNGQYTVDNPAGSNYPNVVENVPCIIGTTQNLNPDFESGTSDWTFAGCTGAIDTTHGSAPGGVGNHALLLTGTNNISIQATAGRINVRPSGYVHAGLWVYPLATSNSQSINIGWYDAGGTIISFANQAVPTLTANQWNFMSFYAGPAPSGAVKAELQFIRNPSSIGLQVWIDEARIIIPEIAGYVDGWNPSFDPSGNLPTVDVALSSARRRLDKNNHDLRSALYRAYTTSAVTAYWSLEDDSGATQVAGFRSASPMAISGQVAFGSTAASIPGASSIVDLRSGGQLKGTVDATQFSSSQWQIEFNGCYASLGASAAVVIQIITDSFTSFGFVMATPTLDDGRSHHVGILLTQVSGDVKTDVYYDGVFDHTTTITSTTLGRPVQVILNAGGGTGDGYPLLASVGLFATADISGMATRASASLGWSGETAAARANRLCLEEGVPVAPIDFSGQSMPMGPQKPKGLLDLLQDCENADGGLLHEPFDFFGLGYLTRYSLYNKPVTFLLDIAQGQVDTPFQPVHDDALRINQSTVTRDGGSSATYIGDTSRGTYKESPTLLLLNDTQCYGIASWRVHLGTPVSRLRYPSLGMNFANPSTASFAAAMVTSLGVGIRVQAINQPSQMYQPVDILVSGYTKTLAYMAWNIQLLGSPYDPWQVDALSTTFRLEMSNQTLLNALDPGATSLLLKTAGESALFTTTATSPADFPVDLNIAGWKIHCTSAQSWLQETFSRTVSNGWGNADTGQSWTTNGGSASDYSVNGSVGSFSLASVNAARSALITAGLVDFDIVMNFNSTVAPTGAQMQNFIQARLNNGTNNFYELVISRDQSGVMQLQIRKAVSATVTNLTSFVTVPGASNTSAVTVRFRVVGSVIQGKAWLQGFQESDWLVTAADSSVTGTGDLRLIGILLPGNTNTLPFSNTMDNLSVRNPQTLFISAAPNNGSVPAGTAVSLWQPSCLPL